MINAKLAVEICAILVFGSVAIAGVETKRPLLTVIFKPLTTVLLFFVVGWPSSSFAKLVDLGILFSLVGDVALLNDSKKAFLLGLGGFFCAHVCYIIAFIGVGTWSLMVLVAAGAGIAMSSLLLRKLWAGAVGLRGPVVTYAVAVTTMAVSAVSTAGGRLVEAPAAVVGAILFYISDSSLALDRFYRRIPHASFLTLGVYWLGQVGIALAARASLD